VLCITWDNDPSFEKCKRNSDKTTGVDKEKGGKKKTRTIGVRSTALFVVILVLMSLTSIAMAIPGQLRLNADTGTYVDDNEDAWWSESLVTSETSFNLTIKNHNGGALYYLYLLVAVDRNPDGNVTISVDGNPIPVSAYNGVITSNNKAQVNETDPVYLYPGHGIYSYGSTVQFAVIAISIPGDGGVLAAGETITVPIVITPTTPVKVHFDAVGADSDNKAIAFVPPSEDVTYETPEFASIVIPVASLLGLLYFFNYRKRRREA
jgi:hypothetical protein